uniref:Uncharacterized protein n=1 Tax=Equus asinus asinus TaxID=83772 RepID=A0A8C4LFJ7_EQUAS
MYSHFIIYLTFACHLYKIHTFLLRIIYPLPNDSHYANQLIFCTALHFDLLANTLSGSSLSQVPSHMYGNRLNPNSSMAALIAQSENNQTDQDLGDNSRSLVGRGSSPRGSLSPRSPVSSLQIRYDQPSSSGLENLPPAAASIEQLLERQWSEGQQFLLEQGTPGDSKHSLPVFKER